MNTDQAQANYLKRLKVRKKGAKNQCPICLSPKTEKSIADWFDYKYECSTLAYHKRARKQKVMAKTI